MLKIYHSLEDTVLKMDKYVKPAMNAMKEPPGDPGGQPIRLKTSRFTVLMFPNIPCFKD